MQAPPHEFDAKRLTDGQSRAVTWCVWCVAAMVFSVLLVACGEEAIEVYQIPKEQTPTDNSLETFPAPEETASSGPAPAASSADLFFDLPEGWVQTPPGPMVLHAIDAGDEISVSITRFPGNVGGMEANVARWARQLGIGPSEIPTDAVAVSPVGSGIQRVRLAHAGQAVLVDVIAHQRQTWFFKMSGPAEPLESRIASFNELMSSARLPGEASTLGNQP